MASARQPLLDITSEGLEIQPQVTAGQRGESLHAELLDFVLERLRAYLVGQVVDGREISIEMFEAVKAMSITAPLDFRRRLLAVHTFVAEPASPNLAAANKRIRNILRQAAAEGSGGRQAGSAGGEVDPRRFEHDAEKALYARLGELEALNARTADYREQLINLAALREPVDAFFDGVMVNADDPAVRANRLALLARLDRLCRSVADLSQLPG